MEIDQDKIDTITAISQRVTYGGAGTAMLFGMTLNTLAALVGMLVAIIGLAVTWYYKHQSFKILQRALQKSVSIKQAVEEANESDL